MSSADPPAVPARDGLSGIGAVDGVLPRELLIEVLLLLPAKEVCRVRAVCPSWRSLTYDPLLVAASGARHPGPILAVRSGCNSIDLVDLSGDVVKRVRTNMYGYDLRVLCTRFEYVLIQAYDHSISLLDPVSGSVSALPVGIAEGLTTPESGHPFCWLAFGQVASTGEYKIVRIVDEDVMCGGYGNDLLCEVFTLRAGIRNLVKNDDPAAYPDEIGQWRKVEKSPPAYLDPSLTNGVVVKGVAYFFFDQWQFEEPYIYDYNIEFGCIPSFNLKTEQWSVALRGPINRILEVADGMLNFGDLADRLMLGEIQDLLVTAHYNKQTFTADLWFLMDFENSVWSRQHIIQLDITPGDMVRVQPLLVLDEGGIILLVQTRSRHTLQVFNPGESKATNLLELTSGWYHVGVGIYTGSLLC